METMWNILNFQSNSTVCHPCTPERDNPNEFHSVEFIRLKVSSTIIPHSFHSHIELLSVPYKLHSNFTIDILSLHKNRGT